MVITTSLNNISSNGDGKFEGGLLSFFQISQISNDEINKNLSCVLSIKERIYYDRLYRNKNRQKEMYCGRLAAKRLIAEKFKYKEELKNIELIKINSKEKPRLFIEDIKIDKDLSIAHNDEYAVVAYSNIGKIGADIEACNLRLEESFINYAFCKEEVKCIEKLEFGNVDIWILLWTIKEAIGKALGIGLSLGMDFVKIFMKEESNIIYLIFNEKKMSNILKGNESIKLFYLIKGSNYVSICHLCKE